MKTLPTIALAASILLGAAPALASGDHGPQGMQDMQGMQGMQGSQGMQGMGMNHMKMMGAHDMAATVSSIDRKTGIVEANADGQKLRLHFPPDTLSGVNAGDKITLHMGFTKQ